MLHNTLPDPFALRANLLAACWVLGSYALPGQSVLPQEDGALDQPPADQQTGDQLTQPTTEPMPPCPEGQVLDEETNLCVLEEPDAAEEEPAQPEPEEEQPSEESDSGDEGSN